MSTIVSQLPEVASPAGGEAGCEFVTLRTPAEFENVAEGWRQLCDRHGGAIEQFDWIATCAEDNNSLRVELVRRGDRLVAAAPLCMESRRGLAWRAMLGVSRIYEPMDLLADGPESLSRLASRLADDGFPLFVGRIPKTSPAIEALKKAFDGRAVIVERDVAGAPYLPLDDSWIHAEENLSSRRRSDLRRALRRAEKLGQVKLEVFEPDCEALDRLLDEAFAVEQASWKGTANTALAQDAERGAFFRRYAARICRQGKLRLCFLRINGRAVAMQIGAVQSNRFHLLKIGYDAEYARCSPGNLLLCESIRHAALSGLESYEFLGRPDDWIGVWTEHIRPCCSLRVYPYSLRGITALSVDSAAAALSRIGLGVRGLAVRLRDVVSRGVERIASRAARGYIAGDSLEDAARVNRKHIGQFGATTLGFWDGPDDTPRQAADQYLSALERLNECGDEGYLSIKLPALNYSRDLLVEVGKRAIEVNRRLHFDSLGTESVDRTETGIEKLRAELPDLRVSTTLPGRWKRSVEDADWVVSQGLPVRVVKGQSADPGDPERDVCQGFLEVIDQLAGRATRVSVATHDLPLAAEAIARLQQQGTPCNLELLYGLPRRRSIEQAMRLGVPVRLYIPYGAAYLPYAVSKLKQNRHVVGWLCRDFLASLLTMRRS